MTRSTVAPPPVASRPRATVVRRTRPDRATGYRFLPATLVETLVRPVPRGWRALSIAIGGAVLLVVAGLWAINGGVQEIVTPAGALTAVGRLTGLLASTLLLIQVLLMARVPVLERAWGQDELTRVHRWVGFWSFTLMVAHIVLIMLGYAAQSAAGLVSTVVDFTVDSAGGLLAVLGTVFLVLVVVTSAKAARRRLRYESWHLLHLYAYLGVGLALPHQLWTGQDFIGSTASTVFWWSLYALTAGSVIVFRVLLPLWRSARAGLRVARVREEQPGVVTVELTGPGVRRLKASGGQFFQWRFLTGRGWTRANPYSLSAAPSAHELRITAATVGEGTNRLRSLRPGTRVLVEGPYGRMHAGARTRPKALLLGAGIGITPIRALLESLPQQPGDVTVLNRASGPSDLVLDDELSALAAQRGARYETLTGSRVRGRDSWLPEQLAHLSDVDALRRVCPDVADRDVFVCGPGPWLEAVRRAALSAGVPRHQLHCELFDY